eukprot:3001559-Amphidinium_carterae.1
MFYNNRRCHHQLRNFNLNVYLQSTRSFSSRFLALAAIVVISAISFTGSGSDSPIGLATRCGVTQLVNRAASVSLLQEPTEIEPPQVREVCCYQGTGLGQCGKEGFCRRLAGCPRRLKRPQRASSLPRQIDQQREINHPHRTPDQITKTLQCNFKLKTSKMPHRLWTALTVNKGHVQRLQEKLVVPCWPVHARFVLLQTTEENSVVESQTQSPLKTAQSKKSRRFAAVNQLR